MPAPIAGKQSKPPENENIPTIPKPSAQVSDIRDESEVLWITRRSDVRHSIAKVVARKLGEQQEKDSREPGLAFIELGKEMRKQPFLFVCEVEVFDEIPLIHVRGIYAIAPDDK